jgi:tight adherence protein C
VSWDFQVELSSLAAAVLVAAAVAAVAVPVIGSLAMLRHRQRRAMTLRGAVGAALARAAKRAVSRRHLDRLAAWLRRAGHPAELQPEELVALTVISGFLFMALGLCLSAFLGMSVVAAPAAALLGVCYPLLWLRDRVKARHAAIARALPYQLDLLTLAVEAGLDFISALGKVVEKGRPGPLRDELCVVLKELKLGKGREEALRNLAARVELPGLTSFVQALVQADRMGTPLGKTLRILSTQMRIERTQRAEKLANEAPVKLLLPLIGCIFPTIFLMLFGPIAYQVFLGGSF